MRPTGFFIDANLFVLLVVGSAPPILPSPHMNAPSSGARPPRPLPPPLLPLRERMFDNPTTAR